MSIERYHKRGKSKRLYLYITINCHILHAIGFIYHVIHIHQVNLEQLEGPLQLLGKTVSK